MLLSCGDALIDFLPGRTAGSREALIPAVGGSCFNVAVAMARLGASAGFVGGVSTDMFGQMIAAHAAASNVDLSYATRSADQTTLAFVRPGDGESRYAFYNAGTATDNWTYRRGAIPFNTIEAVHAGSTTLVSESGAGETLHLIADAKLSSTISFDPNCRPNLVRNKCSFLKTIARFSASADILRMSDADFEYIYGNEPYERRAQVLLDQGASLVVITRGAEGALAWHANLGQVNVGASQVEVEDTIGAGDSFQAALLFALHRQDLLRRTRLKEMSAEQLQFVMTFAAKCAAFTCTRQGADPPRASDIDWVW